MAKLVVKESITEAGVRSIRKLVSTKMGNRMKHALLVVDKGIASGSDVRYSANEELRKIDWRVVASRKGSDFNMNVKDENDHDNGNDGTPLKEREKAGVTDSDGGKQHTP